MFWTNYQSLHYIAKILEDVNDLVERPSNDSLMTHNAGCKKSGLRQVYLNSVDR